ncbi:dipeptide/oligopeptide/nickel ABC transporter ATP-binding protein [Marmoricola sp. Leaf446]|uniref:ABC transporter ATP-binding protein n=1 Tax=Marmoricola sp. Leaf446 TaxID=1736379 RepID=UPI0006FA3AD1|nr:dipeptide ABC transporter ATP-binding protein [Marmoricola sp. Leaf446]KQT92149.1 dipeptide/oligopeptide/nickel ABC transporter ATP-binding protein [Marmoricola sp. Leaf446]
MTTPTTDRHADGATPAPDGDVLLSVEGLVKHFPIKGGFLRRGRTAVQAVDGVDFSVRRGETFSIVGESGCGKSTTARLVTRLLEPTGGTVRFDGQDITHLSEGRMRPLRRDIQMIFQDPYSSLNPRHTVGKIVGAPFRLQGVEPEGGRKQAVQDLLELVGLSPEHYNRYPHEFSGGQRQRIGIARTLALKPRLIVADEPVSALDVSIQAQVVNLLEDLQEELGLTYVMIAHDLSVVRHVSDRVAVMYLGKIVEVADRDDLYDRPHHPYTVAMLSAVPVPDTGRRQNRERIRLQGDVPSPINPPPACRFHTRCWKAQEVCRTEEPPLVPLGGPSHLVACHFPENVTPATPVSTPTPTA